MWHATGFYSSSEKQTFFAQQTSNGLSHLLSVTFLLWKQFLALSISPINQLYYNLRWPKLIQGCAQQGGHASAFVLSWIKLGSIELLNNKRHGLLTPGGLVSPSGGFVSLLQCWTVGPIFTFGRSRMFGPEKLRPLAVDRSRSRRIKNCKTCVIKVLISNHSN